MAPPSPLSADVASHRSYRDVAGRGRAPIPTQWRPSAQSAPVQLATGPTAGRFPIACLTETQLNERYRNAKSIQAAIQKIRPGFRIRVEHFAAILLVELQDLEEQGHLSHKTCDPYELEDRLCEISPFCKHYMLHLDPRNMNPGQEWNRFDPKKLNQERWSHAKPQQPGQQPPLAPGMGPEQNALSMHYYSRFRTGKDTKSLPLDGHKAAEKACLMRDQNKCVITGNSSPRVFWFIPKGFNDTKINNDATGNIQAGCIYLTKISLLANIHSATQLGKTHQVWNMLCVDPVIYDALTQGFCAFKYTTFRHVSEKFSEVDLKFFWMPELRGRFNKETDLEKIKLCKPEMKNGFTTFKHTEKGTELCVDLAIFERENCPAPKLVKKHWPDKFRQPESGMTITVKMPQNLVTPFTTVVKINWACVTFTALCGGAGRAWYLTGMKQLDGSIQPRDDEFRAKDNDEDKKTEEKPYWVASHQRRS